ncbi:MAG: choice-of-anchor J domain-containing protein [Prevotella sp.]|nr:choice-of-anchor J domain-containing protein [Prevotella sp.]
MSKKFTSFLVLAALLLAVPTHAQFAKKQSKAQVSAFKTNILKPTDLAKAKDAKMKADAKFEGQAFRGFAAKGNYLQASLDKVQEDKAILQKQMEENFRAIGKHAQYALAAVPRRIEVTMSTPLKTGRRAEVVDPHGIITSPAEGEVKYYTRTGTAFYYNSGWKTTSQNGHAVVIECTDGTVYLKDPIARLSYDSYIKGTKSGNTISFDVDQPIVYNETYEATVNVKWGTTSAPASSQSPITYTVDETAGTITLNGSSASAVLGGYWTDDNSMQGGEYGTILTYDTEYTPAPAVLVEAPADLTTETWNSNIDNVVSTATIGFKGDDVYVKGLISAFPDAWLKGSVSGTTVTFAKNQFVGVYQGLNIFAAGVDAEGTKLADFVMTYDAVAKTLEGENLLANAADDRIYYLAWEESILVQAAGFAEETATTGANVDAVPYTNALTSAELFADFGVIDSNKDGSTWTFDSSYGTAYKWNSSNAANDWLISPAIKLEAGKKYHFAIDAKAAGASFPEKFEVKLGTEAKASALTQSVLDEVTVTSTTFVTYENFNVSVAATGYYHFGIHATSDADQFRLAVANFLVEAGVEAAAPAAVTDFAVVQTEGKLEAVVSFKAPTKTVGGDDLTDLTQIDILRDGAVIKSLTEGVTPGAELSYVDNDEALTVGTYTYQVIPYNAVGNGEKSEEKSIFLSVALEVPHTFDFSQNLLDQFNVIDNNADGKTWIWSESNGAYYPYHGLNAADDYLITLPFNLKAGKNYNIIVTAKNSGSYAEKFEVKAGKEATVEGLNISVIEPTELTGGTYNDYEGIISPAEDGAYFIAIHAISDPDMLNLSVKTLTVELAPEATAPAAIADFTATPGAEGALEANLAFTAPAKAINGDALTGTVDVKIYRDNVLVNTLTNVAVGSAQTWKDTDVENGETYTYYLVASNASGDGLKSEKKSVFVGEDELGEIDELNVTGTTASTISLSWSEVAGANGGYVNTANVKYAVVSAHVETVWIFQELIIDGILGSVTGETSGTFDYAVDEGEQGYNYFGVVALKADADLPAVGDELTGAYTWALVGAPYDLPLVEGFTGAALHYVWDSNAFLGVSEEDTDGDGVALDIMTEEAGLVYLQSGKVNVKGTANPTIVFNAKSPNVSKLFVYASKDGGEETLVSTINLTEDYESYKVSLANFTSATRYVQFSFVAQLATPYTVNAEGTAIADKGDYITMDDIRVLDLYEYNLKAAIKAPKSVVAGQKAKITATVTNEGENVAKDYVLTIKAGEKTLTTVLGSDELPSFASDEVEVDFETSIFDEAGDVTLTATIEYEDELYPGDNVATAVITVKEPAAVAPTSLLAEDKGKAGVDLTWTVATGGTEEVFENFTSYENGANEALGDWTLVNNNGASKGPIFNDLSLANDGLVKAWEVMKPSEYGISNTQFNGPNGSLEEAYLISAYNFDGESYPDNDDWLISPELPGIAQEISFAIGALDVQYGPSSYEVLVSSTDSEIASFTKVAEGTLTSAGWNSVTAQLPEGTKYFAIRNNTSGDAAMCVMLGDIKFTANSSATVTSFNIYYNGEKIATVEGDKTTYTVAREKVEVGTQTFGVSAVYANGAESRVTVATIEIVTGIQQIAADGKAVDVYSLDGKLIRSQATSLDGLKGLYIVNGKAVMVK